MIQTFDTKCLDYLQKFTVRLINFRFDIFCKSRKFSHRSQKRLQGMFIVCTRSYRVFSTRDSLGKKTFFGLLID